MHALRDREMIPALLASGIILYGVIQLIVALIAVALAWKWKKYEFLAGLSFLLIYSMVEIIDVYFFTILNEVYLDVAQFGFILLAIICFIIGMHPSWAPRLISGMMQRSISDKTPRNESIISFLRRS